MAFLLRASREADDGAIEMTGFAVASLLIPDFSAGGGAGRIRSRARGRGPLRQARALIYFLRVDLGGSHVALPNALSK